MGKGTVTHTSKTASADKCKDLPMYIATVPLPNKMHLHSNSNPTTPKLALKHTKIKPHKAV